MLDKLKKIIQMIVSPRRSDEDKEPFKILGRPITLADVMIVLEKKGQNYAVDYEGEFIHFFKKDDSGCMIPHWESKFWDLTKNLDGQSEETIEFLYNLIK